MKKLIFMLMMVVTTVKAENIVKAIVITSDSTAKEMAITSTTDDIMSSVNNEMIETFDGEYIVIKQYILTGVWVSKNDVLFVYPIDHPNNLMIGTAFAGGVIIGLYCPLTPKHIVNYHFLK